MITNYVVKENSSNLIFKVDIRSAERVGITKTQIDTIHNIIRNEIQKIRETFGFTHYICLNLTFSKAKTRWGQMRTICRGVQTLKGEMSLSLMTVLGHEYGDKLVNTIMHELLHLMPNGGSHKGKWAEYANAINRKYGYNIKRCSNGNEFNIPAEICEKKSDIKYIVCCPQCHTQWKYTRKTQTVKYPHQYNCGKCKVHLERMM